MKKVCIATSTRADWGLLKPIAGALRDNPDVELQILATNMHLSERYGHTVDEILADGFEITAAVPMDVDGDGECDRAIAMAQCLEGSAKALGRLRPDAMIILGDRYEMLAVASAATVMRVPVIHIAGGEISEGAIDDSIRHAITKLSTLHFTATESYRQRVIAMGENPRNVIFTGAIGVWNLFHGQIMDGDELHSQLGIPKYQPFAVVTYHPATCDDADPVERFDALLEALDRFPELHIVITYPNNDARSHGIIDRIEEYGRSHRDRVTVVKSLGMKRYLAAIREAVVVIGNSSSGLVEVPSAGTPTVNIGIRQKGRIAGPSVIQCGDSADEIAAAVDKALSKDVQIQAGCCINPYAKENTLDIMMDNICSFLASLPCEPKKFYDVKKPFVS